MRRAWWREARILRRHTGLWLLCVAYSVLLVYGSVQSVERVRGRQTEIASAADDFARRWSALRAAAGADTGTSWSDWRSPSLVGGPNGFAVTWIPVDGLAVLSAGESVRVSTVRRISLYPQVDEPPLENPLSPAGGIFDLSFVVIWLLPLTIVAATHGAVSADRQDGTWTLIAATTSTPLRILIARLALPAVALASVTLLVAVTSVLVSVNAMPRAGEWVRLGAWCLLVIGYGAFWAVAAGIVTARTRTAALSLMTLGLLWMALVWVVPGVTDAAISWMNPPLNRLDAHVAARETQRDLEARLPEMLEQIYAGHATWRPSADAVAAANRPVPGGPASRDSRRVYAPAMVAADAAAPFARRLAEHKRRTELLVRRASVLSPALAVQLISDHLAGTSADHFVAFERHATEAEVAWHAFFAPRILQLRDMTRADMEAVPTPGPLATTPSAAGLAWPVAGLAFALALSSWLLARSSARLRS